MSTAIIMFSSGATGIPKGIVHTYRNMASLVSYYSERAKPNVRFMFINPMVNSGGTSIAISATVGHSCILTTSDFSEDNLLDAIHEFKVRFYRVSSNLRRTMIVSIATDNQHVSNPDRLALSPSEPARFRCEQRF